MKTSWSLQVGYEKLQLNIENGNIYAMFAGQPISDSEVCWPERNILRPVRAVARTSGRLKNLELLQDLLEGENQAQEKHNDECRPIWVRW